MLVPEVYVHRDEDDFKVLFRKRAAIALVRTDLIITLSTMVNHPEDIIPSHADRSETFATLIDAASTCADTRATLMNNMALAATIQMIHPRMSQVLTQQEDNSQISIPLGNDEEDQPLKLAEHHLLHAGKGAAKLLILVDFVAANIGTYSTNGNSAGTTRLVMTSVNQHPALRQSAKGMMDFIRDLPHLRPGCEEADKEQLLANSLMASFGDAIRHTPEGIEEHLYTMAQADIANAAAHNSLLTAMSGYLRQQAPISAPALERNQTFFALLRTV